MAFFRNCGPLLALALLTACATPEYMHVTEGTSPGNIDTAVRFRTTYYFRVFDYCHPLNPEVSGKKYALIIPQTDTVYRYRMTGKASSLFNNIKFESGVLGADQIEPFGKNVHFDANSNVFVVGDNADLAAAKAAERQKEAARVSAQKAVEALALLKEKVKDPATKSSLEAAINKLLAAEDTAPLEGKLNDLAASLKAIETKVAGKVGAADIKKAIDDATPKIVEAAKANAEDAKSLCPLGATVKRGFQVMGPEGIHTFDQDQRLVMAMSSSAQPLIETLQEYSGRILNAKTNSSDLLLPLSRETVRTMRAQRKLDDTAAKIGDEAPPSADDIFKSALEAFAEN